MASFDFNYAIVLKDKFTGVAGRVRRSLEKVDASLSTTSGKLEKMGKKFSNLSRRMMVPMAIMLLAAREGIKAADKQEVAINILNNTLGKHNKFLKGAIDNTEKFERVTRFSQEALLNSAQTVAQFTKSGRAARDLMLPIMNLAAGMGKNLQESTLAVVKSLTTTRNILQQDYGIQIKKGLEGAAKYHAIISAVQARFRGSAFIMGRTGAGQMIIAGHMIAKVWKDISMIILPALDKISIKVIKLMNVFDNFVEKNKKLTKIIALVTISFLALATIATIIAGIVGVVSITFGVLAGVAVVLGHVLIILDVALSPIGLLIIGIGVAAFYLYNKFKLVRDITKEIIKLLKEVNIAALHPIATLEKLYSLLHHKGSVMSIHHKMSPYSLQRPIFSTNELHIKLDVNDPGNIISKAHISPHKKTTTLPTAFNMSHIYG